MKTLLCAGALLGCAVSLSAQLVTGFEGYDNGTQVAFRQPSFSGSTSGNQDIALGNFSVVTNVFPAGNPNSGANVYNVLFAFKPDLATPWVRLTSNGATTLPNPAVSFTAGLSLDIYSDKPLYLSLLLRETNTQEPIGGNGGTANGIEFVGGVPTGASKGKLVPANTWTTLVFDIPTESVTAFAGTTANGILESTTGKGALEALGIAADANSAGVYNIYLDNIQVIPEPSVITLFGLGALALFARARRHNA